MLQCPYCRNTARSGTRFCSRCGRPLATAVAPPQTATAYQQIALYGGLAALVLLLVVGAWVLFRNGGSNEKDATEVASSTETPSLSTTSVATPLTETVSSPIPPETTPTLGPLRIPGTDIEVPRISDEEEIEIGREIAEQVEREFGIYRDPAQLERVTRIGQAIVPFADRGHLPYTFTLLDTNEINAFAVPGGFIYVTRGMLNFVHNDDELAGVIGHEIAHVARRHGGQRLEAFAVAEAGIKILVDREPRLEDIYETEEGKFATQMTAVLLFGGWSRQHEFEADEYGTIYMARAGYSSRAVINLFQRMDDTFSGRGDDTLSRLLSTHPPFPDRIQRVETVIIELDL
jgi:predicted Zn-dependent protease